MPKCLCDSAGLIPLDETTPGAVLGGPEGLVPERREAYRSLIDTVRIDAVGVDANWDDEAIFQPIRVGNWESVLATLLALGDWQPILDCAHKIEEDR